MERFSQITRKTTETDIVLSLQLESSEKSILKTGVPFLDHMISAFSKHGKMKLDVKCDGDIEVDDHHSVEDIGICLGLALKEAVGSKKGIKRFGSAKVPMDDSLAEVIVDFSGRPYYCYHGDKLNGYIGRYNEELTTEFFYALAVNAGVNLHIKLEYGENRHHIHEAIFKAAGLAFKNALEIDLPFADEIPSTKGVL